MQIMGVEAYLRENATTDFAPGRDKLSKIENGIPFYNPMVFHCAKTLRYTEHDGHIPILIKDFLDSRCCVDIYQGEGFAPDAHGYAMLNNHPIGKVRIRGNIDAERYTEYSPEKCFIFMYISDGSSSEMATMKVPLHVYRSEALRLEHNKHLILEFRGQLHFYNGNLELNVTHLQIVGRRGDLNVELNWFQECLEFRNKYLVKPWIIDETDKVHTVDLDPQSDNIDATRVPVSEYHPHSRGSILNERKQQCSLEILPTESSIDMYATTRSNTDCSKSEDSPEMESEASSPTDYIDNEITHDDNTEYKRIPKREADSFDMRVSDKRIRSLSAVSNVSNESNSINNNAKPSLHPKANSQVSRNNTSERENYEKDPAKFSIQIVKTPKLMIEILKVFLNTPNNQTLTSKELFGNTAIDYVLNQIIMTKVLSETIKVNADDEVIVFDGTFSKLQDELKPESISEKKRTIFMDCLLDLAKDNLIYFTKSYHIVFTTLLKFVGFLVESIKSLMTLQERKVKKLLQKAKSTLDSTRIYNFLVNAFEELVNQVLEIDDVSSLLSERIESIQNVDRDFLKALISWLIFESDEISKGGFKSRQFSLDQQTMVELKWSFVPKINTLSLWEYKAYIRRTG